MMYELPKKEEIFQVFDRATKELDIYEKKDCIKDLVMYEMTDGTRTSTDLEGWRSYFDGGLFIIRFIEILRILGGKNLYVNVIHEGHKFRSNYPEIYRGMLELVPVYREYSEKNNVKWKFVGDYTTELEPGELKGAQDFRKYLKDLEEKTKNNTDLAVFFMINYSTKWASEEGRTLLQSLPEANVIIRHCKGYVNGDMWLYGKLDNNSFVYAQNGSSGMNWSDRQLVYLISLSLRSMILNEGTHLLKKYKHGERDEIKKKREIELSFIHKSLYKNEKKFPKRVIIFSPLGPEVYEF